MVLSQENMGDGERCTTLARCLFGGLGGVERYAEGALMTVLAAFPYSFRNFLKLSCVNGSGDVWPCMSSSQYSNPRVLEAGPPDLGGFSKSTSSSAKRSKRISGAWWER